MNTHDNSFLFATNIPSQHSQRIRVKLFIFILSLVISENIFANPEGGVVAGGNVTITTPSSATVQINQSSNKAIINWNSFNIAPNEKINVSSKGQKQLNNCMNISPYLSKQVLASNKISSDILLNLQYIF